MATYNSSLNEAVVQYLDYFVGAIPLESILTLSVLPLVQLDIKEKCWSFFVLLEAGLQVLIPPVELISWISEAFVFTPDAWEDFVATLYECDFEEKITC